MTDEHKKAVDEAAEKVAAAATDEKDKIVGGTSDKEPAVAITKNGEGLYQKLFMGLLSVVFVFLAGAYVKLAGDVADTSDIAREALTETKAINTRLVTIDTRLATMDTADVEAATAVNNRLQESVDELERQRRRDDLETPPR